MHSGAGGWQKRRATSARRIFLLLGLLVFCLPGAVQSAPAPEAPPAYAPAKGATPRAEKPDPFLPDPEGKKNTAATLRPEGAPGAEDPFGYIQPDFEKSAPPSLWGVMGNLLLVFGLLGLVLWLVKKFLPGPLSEMRRSRHMRVLDTLPVALNRQLMLVSVAGEVRLLANTEKGLVDLGRVENLGVLEQELAEEFGAVLRTEMEGTVGRLRQRVRRLGEQPGPGEGGSGAV